MHNRLVRLLVVLLLLGAAAGGVYVVRQAGGQQGELSSSASERDAQVDRLMALVSELSAAQAGYVAPDSDPGAALERFPTLLREATSVTGRLAATPAIADAGEAVRALVDATSALAQADARAREHLLTGDVQSATMVILDDARQATLAMTWALVDLRASDHEVVPPPADRSQTVLAVVALVWTGGLLLLALTPGSRRVEPIAMTTDPAPALPVMAPLSPQVARTAELCSQMARVEQATELTALLERAVTILDADNVVVWMASGERLHPVATAGDTVELLLVPLSRHDGHPAVTAWTRREVAEVPPAPEDPGTQAGRDEIRTSVIAIPLYSGSQVRGALTVVFQAGDASTRACAMLIAAQLSTIVTGAPQPASAATGT